MITDTIVAIATPPGAGGIGIIRISGSRAIEVVSQIFRKSKKRDIRNISTSFTSKPYFDNVIEHNDRIINKFAFNSHTVTHGYIVDTSSDTLIDEVLVIPMLSPRSYTAEDVVEIQAHSGSIVMRTILELILSKDVRLAEPGEFTKRAFLNGRIDLTQAEAVADIINARSSSALRIAVSQGLGNLKKSISLARQNLIDFLANIEASIDFPDETNELVQNGNVIEVVNKILEICNCAIQNYEDAHFLRDGLKLSICGLPNVGKSTLMNRLMEKEKSIVTSFSGTTRDIIEDSININGIPFVISDTAGIHQTDNPIEKIGIEKAKENIAQSDIVLFMVDVFSFFNPSAGEDNANNVSDITDNSPFNINNYLTDKSYSSVVLKKIESIIPANKKVIIILNKIDKLHEEDRLSIPEEIESIPVIPISAKYNDGIDLIKKKIINIATANLNNTNIVKSNGIISSSSVVPNIRQKTALKKASESLNLALENLLSYKNGYPAGEETLAIDIRNSIDYLGEITGDNAGVDILDHIFSKFCIGK